MTSLDDVHPVVGNAAVTPVRPGDVLAVQLGYEPSSAELNDLKAQLAAALPRGVNVVFFGADVKFGILRPDGAA